MRGGLLDSRQGWGAAERLHEGFWRRVKTQESLPSEGAEPFRSRWWAGADIRSWSALKRISVKRANAEEGK